MIAALNIIIVVSIILVLMGITISVNGSRGWSDYIKRK